MGAINSKEMLKRCTSRDISRHVTEMGEKYTDYVARIEESGIDGPLLASASQQTLDDIMDRLQVTERLHRRKLERVLSKIISSPQFETVYSTEDSSFSASDCSNSHLTIDTGKTSRTDGPPSHRASTGSLNSRRRSRHHKSPSDIPIDMVMECALAAQNIDELTCDKTDKLVPSVLDAVLAAQALEKENLQNDVLALEKEMDRNLDSPPADGMVAIVLTDVEHSTSLWESCPEAMKEALALHDTLARQLREKNHGYEIDTEGDAFFLAFSEPCDALAFALDLQTALHEAPWSEEILATEWARDDGQRRGLRVRVSVHLGPVETLKNPVTGRTEYDGEGMDVAQEVEKMTRGGQILTSIDTWNAAFHLADVKLGSPTISEYKDSLVLTDEDADDTLNSKYYKRVVELTPASMKKLSKDRVKKARPKFTRKSSQLMMKHRPKLLSETDTLTAPIRA